MRDGVVAVDLIATRRIDAPLSDGTSSEIARSGATFAALGRIDSIKTVNNSLPAALKHALACS